MVGELRLSRLFGAPDRVSFITPIKSHYLRFLEFGFVFVSGPMYTYNITTTKEVAPMSATVEYLERQATALLELIEKKDEYITRLQDEVSKQSQTIYTVRAEQQNFRNSVKEYVVEALTERQMTHDVAETLANLLDFELTKTVTVTATVDFEIELEVPFDVDADDVANGLEFSVDSFDYSIDDFSLDVSSLQASDNIS